MALHRVLCFGILANQAKQLMEQSGEDAEGSFNNVVGRVDRRCCFLPRSWAALCGTENKKISLVKLTDFCIQVSRKLS